MVVNKEPGNIVSCKQPIYFEFQLNDYGPEFYVKCVLEIFESSRTRVVTFYGYTSPDQKVVFNLKNLLNDYFKNRITAYKALDDNTVQTLDDDNFVEVTATFTEHTDLGWGSEYKWGETKGDALAFSGGFSYESWPNLKYFNEWFSGFALKPFFTWRNKISLIGKKMPLYLTYCTIGGTLSLKLKISITYTDNSTFTGYFFNTDYIGKLLSFPVGIEQLNLTSLNPSKTIAFYKAEIVDVSNTVLSQSMTFIVDQAYYESEVFCLFKNSLSGRDTVRFVGKAEFSSDFARIISENFKGEYDNSIGKNYIADNHETGGMKVSTGFITRTEVDWLRDLFASKLVHLVYKGNVIPCQIASKKFTNPLTSDLNSLTVELDYLTKNSQYTPNKIEL